MIKTIISDGPRQQVKFFIDASRSLSHLTIAAANQRFHDYKSSIFTVTWKHAIFSAPGHYAENVLY
jgi:hypothetical protein